LSVKKHGLFFYWKKGQVDLRAGVACAAGFLVGGYLGSLVAIEISSNHLRGMFGVFLVVASLLLLRQGRAPEKDAVTGAAHE